MNEILSYLVQSKAVQASENKIEILIQAFLACDFQKDIHLLKEEPDVLLKLWEEFVGTEEEEFTIYKLLKGKHRREGIKSYLCTNTVIEPCHNLSLEEIIDIHLSRQDIKISIEALEQVGFNLFFQTLKERPGLYSIIHSLEEMNQTFVNKLMKSLKTWDENQLYLHLIKITDIIPEEYSDIPIMRFIDMLWDKQALRINNVRTLLSKNKSWGNIPLLLLLKSRSSRGKTHALKQVNLNKEILDSVLEHFTFEELPSVLIKEIKETGTIITPEQSLIWKKELKLKL